MTTTVLCLTAVHTDIPHHLSVHLDANRPPQWGTAVAAALPAFDLPADLCKIPGRIGWSTQVVKVCIVRLCLLCVGVFFVFFLYGKEIVFLLQRTCGTVCPILQKQVYVLWRQWEAAGAWSPIFRGPAADWAGFSSPQLVCPFKAKLCLIIECLFYSWYKKGKPEFCISYGVLCVF